MSTSLARRIRRIGLLPKLTFDQVMNADHLTKLKNAEDKLVKAEGIAASKVDEASRTKALGNVDKAKAYYDEVRAAIQRELDPARVQRLALTTEEIAAETSKLKLSAKARRREVSKASTKSVKKAA